MSKVTVTYDNYIDTELDDEIHKIAKRKGYEFIGSGCNLKTGKRDMTFEKQAQGRRHVVVEQTSSLGLLKKNKRILDKHTMSVSGVLYTEDDANAEADELDGVGQKKEWTFNGDDGTFWHNGKEVPDDEVLNALNSGGEQERSRND